MLMSMRDGLAWAFSAKGHQIFPRLVGTFEAIESVSSDRAACLGRGEVHPWALSRRTGLLKHAPDDLPKGRIQEPSWRGERFRR